MSSKAQSWSNLSFPPRSALDTFFLALNLLPLALSAAVRASFWKLCIPLTLLDGWSERHRRHVRWARDSVWCSLPEERGSSGEAGSTLRLKDLVEEVVLQGAHRFPHSHGRPFHQHLTGIAKLIAHWEQPERLCLAALLHSAYSTEMFPWGLYSFSQRDHVRGLIGSDAESSVFLYCTVSQKGIYKEVLRLVSLNEGIPATGLSVRNCQTGETKRMPAEDAAMVLVLLGADIAEQDPFFDMHLTASLVHLAARHLQHPPALAAKLESAGFFMMSREEHRTICHHARNLLRAGPSAALGDLLATAAKAPWLYELGLEVCRRGKDEGGHLGRVSVRWCEVWGTGWSRIYTPQEEMKRVLELVGAPC